MKYLKLLLTVGLFLFSYGCEEFPGPSLPPGGPADSSEKPISLWLEIIPDPELGLTPCTGGAVAHAGGWLKGYGTYLGKFDWNNSFWRTNTCACDPDKKELTNVIQGSVVNEHGDALWTETEITIILNEAFQPVGFKVVSGRIFGGSGRFEGVYGSFPPAAPDQIVPISSEGDAKIFMEGYIVFPKGETGMQQGEGIFHG